MSAFLFHFVPASLRPCIPSFTLAQASQRTFDVLLWIGVLVVGLLVLAGVVVWIKRRLDRWQQSDAAPPFSLHELQVLRDTGKMSEDEYQRARQRLIAMTRVALTASPPPSASDSQSPEGENPPDKPGGA